MIKIKNIKTGHIANVSVRTAKSLLKSKNEYEIISAEIVEKTSEENKLTKLTKLELEDICLQRGIEVNSKDKKDDLINKINTAEQK